MAPHYETVVPVTYNVGEPGQLEAAVRQFHEDGYVMLQVLERPQADDAVIECWENLVDGQPYRPEYKIPHPNPRVEREKFLAFAKSPPANLKQWQEGWTFHRGFGACCDPLSFHSQLIWDVRQNAQTYSVASGILGRRDLWVDINRTITKLPGEGDDEFLHWDWSPWRAGDQELTHIAGKVSYNGSSIILAPRTHRAEFLEQFKAQYGPYYPHATNGTAAKFGLDIGKPDPMNIFGDEARGEFSAHCKRFMIPPGCWLAWDHRLLHGTVKTDKKGPTEYGMYLGFFPAVSRDAYYEKAKNGMTEKENRVHSYLTAELPALWPSLDRVHYFPFRFYNFNRFLETYLQKWIPGWPGVTTRQQGNGRTVRHAVPVVPGDYVPATLTPLGERLLGWSDWNV